MTQPDQGQQQGQQGGQSSAKPAKVKPGDVVRYTHHDHLLNRPHTGVGVVVEVGASNEAVQVRPLAHHTVGVDPADVAPLSADDVTA